MSKPIIVIAGVGNATGTGAALAREYARSHRIALVGRQGAEPLAQELLKNGAEAQAFVIQEYSHTSLADVFKRVREAWPDSRIRTAVWNAAQWSRIAFLDITEADLKRSMNMNVVAAFAFSQEVLRAFLAPGAEPGGTLLITGATSATRGASHFGLFAAGKHGLRAMSQAIAREFGRQKVHVCFVIVDGAIATDRIRTMMGGSSGSGDADEDRDRREGWLDDRTKRLDPTSIAKAYRFIDEQSPDAWTLEMDLRPSGEVF